MGLTVIGQVRNRAIENAGGLDNWNALPLEEATQYFRVAELLMGPSPIMIIEEHLKSFQQGERKITPLPIIN
ncbi:hypothetical protein [Persicobacter psychrovividus]|uniref:Uncharacterized protein n=1 Tax=Persicobacter psychrovividus TaxID=387638 RepID=A0ABM7VCU9_9BACT|nr:hypothetical protein PEPS_10400 [Persicobacter psychrovividus]